MESIITPFQSISSSYSSLYTHIICIKDNISLEVSKDVARLCQFDVCYIKITELSAGALKLKNFSKQDDKSIVIMCNTYVNIT